MCTFLPSTTTTSEHVASLLLDRIAELESAQQMPNAHPYAPPVVSTAYPRSLAHANDQRRFAMNLDKGMAESELEDPSVDPILQSKHVGPNARRRMEAEAKERVEEEQREARRNARRPRGRGGAKEKERGRNVSDHVKGRGPRHRWC